jgi:ribosome-associated protein
VAIDLSEQLVLNQVFLLVTGSNEPQLQALSEEVQRKLAEVGEKPVRKEGSGSWILLDYTDLVVHIQSTELRNYYMLDRLWNDCPKIELGLAKAVR